jgi:tRNA (cmo5U34)-methyltransferase
MQTSDKQRFTQMAEDYDQMAPLLVPMYGFLQDEMIRQAEIASLSAPRVVDLGAGSGRLLEKVLTANPYALCYWVDSSESFRSVAQRRLARFGERVNYVLSAIESDWMSQVEPPVQAIFSMSAIHHLESGEKRAAYATCFDLLAPGGWFINADEMRSLDREAYRASLHFWAAHVDAAAAGAPASLGEFVRRWQHHFDNWKRRNIEGFDLPKTKGDDLHEPFTDQVQWLREIGFVHVDVFVKYHLWCMVGGRKPALCVPVRDRSICIPR